MNSFSLTTLKFPTAIIGVLFLLSSCSSLIERNSLFDQSAPKKEAGPQMVPKAQYDQLLSKYEELLQKSTNAQAPTEIEAQSAADVVENLAQSTETIQSNNIPELAETVDVFGDGQAPNPTSLSRKQVAAPQAAGGQDILENQLLSLRKAKKLVMENQFNQAMAQLKGLEDAPSPQVRVRAKYLIGDILYKQQSYDLSMQVFEDIVHNFAFSGVVLDALRKLIVCSEKLNLPKKKELYFSMLHDFF